MNKRFLNLNETDLIKACIENDRKAQFELYNRFGPGMKLTCMRYLIDKNSAEDILNQGFLKVFTNLKSYQGSGSLEGWIRRIIINECIDRNRTFKPAYDLDETKINIANSTAADYSFSGDYLLRVIDSLLLGYKTVFNLVEIDGYNHAEVGRKLNISESASRSQLAKAKQVLRKKLENY